MLMRTIYIMPTCKVIWHTQEGEHEEHVERGLFVFVGSTEIITNKWNFTTLCKKCILMTEGHIFVTLGFDYLGMLILCNGYVCSAVFI